MTEQTPENPTPEEVPAADNVAEVPAAPAEPVAPAAPANEFPPPPPSPAAEQPTGAVPPPPPPSAGWAAAAPQGGAPFGVDPFTGLPYSDKTKLIAGLLQILLPFGVGRLYIGDTKTGIAQLLVTIITCGAGSIWSWIDGILILVGQPKDANGLPLR